MGTRGNMHFDPTGSFARGASADGASGEQRVASAFEAMWGQLGGEGEKARLFASFQKWAAAEGVADAPQTPHTLTSEPSDPMGRSEGGGPLVRPAEEFLGRRATCPMAAPEPASAPPPGAPMGLFAPQQHLPADVVVDPTVQAAFHDQDQDSAAAAAAAACPPSPTDGSSGPATSPVSKAKRRHRASVTNAPPTIIKEAGLTPPDGDAALQPVQKAPEKAESMRKTESGKKQKMSPQMLCFDGSARAAPAMGEPGESQRSPYTASMTAAPDPPRKRDSNRKPARMEPRVDPDAAFSFPTASGAPASFRYSDVDDQWAVVIFCGSSGVIRLWSAGMEQQTGTSAASAIGTDVTVFLPSTSAQAGLWETVRCLKQKHEHSRRASGSRRQASVGTPEPRPLTGHLTSDTLPQVALSPRLDTGDSPPINPASPVRLANMERDDARAPTLPMIDVSKVEDPLLPQKASEPPADVPSLLCANAADDNKTTPSCASLAAEEEKKTSNCTLWDFNELEQSGMTPQLTQTMYSETAYGVNTQIVGSHLDRTVAFLKADGINKAHLKMRLVLTRDGSSIMALARPNLETKSHGYMLWVMEQLERRIGSLNKMNLRLSDSIRQNDGPPSSPMSSSASSPRAEDFTQLIKTSKACLGYIERARTTGFDHWGPLNIRTLLRKIIAEHQSAEDACINLNIHDSVTDELLTDVNLFPEMIQELIGRAIEAKNESVSVEVLNEDEFTIVQVIDDGATLPLDVLDAVERGESEAEPTLVGAKQTMEKHLGGEIIVEKTTANSFTRRLRTFTSRRVAPSTGDQSGSKFKKLREISHSLKFLQALSGKKGLTGPLSSTGSLLARALRANRDSTGTTVTLKFPRLAVDECYGEQLTSMHSQSTLRAGTKISEDDIKQAEADLKDAREEILGMGAAPLVKCMLVENHPLYRQAFSSFLWGRSYSISFVNSAVEAVPLLESVDLLVIDLDVKTIDVDAILKELIRQEGIQVLIAYSSSKKNKEKTRDLPSSWVQVQLPLIDREINHALSRLEANIIKGMIQKLKIEEFRVLLSDRKMPWKRGRELGKGSFGRVYEATVEVTGAKMAVKVLPLSGEKDEEKTVLNEIQLMSGFCSENIIHYLWGEITETELLIFMEFAGDGSLSDKVPPGGMDEQTASMYMEGILRGLDYLHEQGVVHRDIKTANVLLNKGVVKLTDFGCALKKNPDQKDGEAEDFAGTIFYMAPEVVKGETSGTPSDIWSVGCLLMALMHGTQPFWNVGGQFPLMRWLSKLKDGEPVDFAPEKNGGKFTENVVDFLEQSLVVNPKDRLTAGGLLGSSFVMANAAMMRKTTVIESLTSRRTLLENEDTRAGNYNPTDGLQSPITAEDVLSHSQTDGESGSDVDSSISGWG
eukprot:TRINITY_DN17933_c0_g1_i1.p1 TRINITY_DN17933_c0_g1~~TRINITY_DN17933_c0_g1_i1.p1  ORF type:complete len:1387 (+),score=492.33 TRINITY_DN17933_c0_g1_i1:121-4281(+)